LTIFKSSFKHVAVFEHVFVLCACAQMDAFRALKANEEGTTKKQLAGNFRPVKELNDRVVYLSVVVGAAPTINGGHLLMSAVVCLAALVWVR